MRIPGYTGRHVAERGGRKGKSGKKRGPEVFEETMQVRVRRKNPLIERKVTDQPTAADSQTVGEVSPLAVPEPGRSLYDEEENSETTQEFELPDRVKLVERMKLGGKKRSRSSKKVKPRPVSGPKLYLDEDATEIADSALDLASKEAAAPPAVAAPPAAALPPQQIVVQPVGAVPRNLLGKWGTDAVGAAAQRANVERKAQAMVPVSAPALKVMRNELVRDHLDALERILSGELDERGGEAGLSPKRSLEHLINEATFQELALPERGKLLEAIAGGPRDITTIKAAIALLKSGVARRLRPVEREKLFKTFLGLSSDCRALLARLSARPLRTRSALEDRDGADVGLVSHLYTLSNELKVAPAVERAGFKRELIAVSVLSWIAHPERMAFEEGPDGVLGMIEFGLADCSPAELTRLWLELVTNQSAKLAGEGELDLAAKLRGHPNFQLTSRETPLRVALEQLSGLANPRRGGERSAFMMPGGHGVDADVISRVLALLYGVGFTVAAGAPSAQRHLERASADPQRVPPVFVTLLYERGERLFLFDHLENDEVYIRVPHGRSSKRKGAQRVDPIRVVEDPERGLDKISRDELRELVGVALVPRN